MEELYIKNIENGIRAIRMGIKSPQTANLSSQFTKLRILNEGLAEDLMTKYKNVVSEYNKRNQE